MTSSPSHAARSAISRSTAVRIGLGEADVLVDRVDDERPGLAVGLGVELPDEPVVVEDRQRVVAPAALVLGFVHLEDELEAEELLSSHPVMDEPVERAEQRRPPLQLRQVEVCRVDPPGARHPVDLGGLTGTSGIGILARHDGAGGPGDAEGAEPAFVAVRDGLVQRERRQPGRVDALGEVEVALTALASGDGDLPAQREGLEHLGGVAVVGPACRGPGHDARVGDVAREQRTLGLESGEDVATERVVGGQPVDHERVGLGVAHLGDDGGHVLGTAHEGNGLDEGAVVLECAGQVGRVVAAAEPAPQHEVGAGCDGRGRVDLQQGQPLDDLDEVGRARQVEQLRVDRDATRLVDAEPEHHVGDASRAVRRRGGSATSHRWRDGCGRPRSGRGSSVAGWLRPPTVPAREVVRGGMVAAAMTVRPTAGSSVAGWLRPLRPVPARRRRSSVAGWLRRR